MRVVLQRVSEGSVVIDNNTVAEIKNGFLLLLGVKNGDTEKDAIKLANKISGLRIFTDENDKMNLSLADVGGSVIVVSNFTLYADCSHGRRPSFINAAKPDLSNPLYEFFCEKLRENGVSDVQTGEFGADMQVKLVNDGPVTLVIDSEELK
ncbi:MAG: D-aminoacyl-tRNA deacylase [Ruminococcus sp.]|jgi:D-tyrosyl-tRNA(Tyr) deacylase|nr:D-aminoacyl-tRNA deacylase [Ruminococcus sp.]